MSTLKFFKYQKKKNTRKKYYTALEIKKMWLKEKKLPKAQGNKKSSSDSRNLWWIHWS